jgi:hypothetical protein
MYVANYLGALEALDAGITTTLLDWSHNNYTARIPESRRPLIARGEPISTTGLVRACYPVEHIFGGRKSWHRSNVARVERSS